VWRASTAASCVFVLHALAGHATPHMYVSFQSWLHCSQPLLFPLLVQAALDAGEAAAEGRQLLAQAAAAAAGPAAPRVQLSFQLAGHSSNASLAEAIKAISCLQQSKCCRNCSRCGECTEPQQYAAMCSMMPCAWFVAAAACC
jgi:hypothetical protein